MECLVKGGQGRASPECFNVTAARDDATNNRLTKKAYKGKLKNDMSTGTSKKSMELVEKSLNK